MCRRISVESSFTLYVHVDDLHRSFSIPEPYVNKVGIKIQSTLLLGTLWLMVTLQHRCIASIKSTNNVPFTLDLTMDSKQFSRESLWVYPLSSGMVLLDALVFEKSMSLPMTSLQNQLGSRMMWLIPFMYMMLPDSFKDRAIAFNLALSLEKWSG